MSRQCVMNRSPARFRACSLGTGQSSGRLPRRSRGLGIRAARRTSLLGDATRARTVFLGRSRSNGRLGGSGTLPTRCSAGPADAGAAGAELDAKANGALAKEFGAVEEEVARGAGADTAAT